MGKNQQHKHAQLARHSANDPDAAVQDQGDGTIDATFHSPEWHAARIAALTTERMSWEDFKRQQKDKASLEAAAAEDEEKAMREYRAQLDADRLQRLSKGTNNAHLKDSKSSKKRKRSEKKKDKSKKDKSKKDRKSKKRKKESRKHASSGSSSSSGSDSSDSEQQRKPKKASSPIRLSEFLRGK